jgi:hypothetical protein
MKKLVTPLLLVAACAALQGQTVLTGTTILRGDTSGRFDHGDICSGWPGRNLLPPSTHSR